MIGALETLLAIPAGLLPSRWWPELPSLPIRRMAAVSALATMAAGFAIGIPGFFRFAERVASEANALMLSGRLGPITDRTAAAPLALSAIAPFLYALTTPLGLFSLYLVVSGFARSLMAFVDDARGDFVLTAIVGAVTSGTRRARESAARAERSRREGPQVPDRLYRGAWAGLPQADFVVVSARRKPGWEAGVFVITSDKWYRLGAPFDLELPEGLRTVYPLTELKTPEVLRKGVPYELPPIMPAPPRPVRPASGRPRS